jgi:lipopolysaccharide transport system permease protein
LLILSKRKNMIDNHTIIYAPNKYVKISPLHLFMEIRRDFALSFSLGWRLFLRDFSAKYRQQAFGFLWAVASPFMAVMPFVLLAKGGIINVSGIGAPYPLYAFLGVSLWSLMQGVTISVAGLINSTGPLIVKINFPRESLLISPVMISLIDFAVKMVIFCIMSIAYGYPLVRMAYIAGIIPLLLAGLGLGMFLAIIGAVFKDISTILGYFFQFLMLLTPILYARPSSTLLSMLSSYNPIYYLVAFPRDMVIDGQSGMLAAYGWCSLGAVLLFFLGWRFYKVAMTRITERI